jgi:ATP-dependent Clp protease ATP-binding subunit ClpA
MDAKLIFRNVVIVMTTNAGAQEPVVLLSDLKFKIILPI